MVVSEQIVNVSVEDLSDPNAILASDMVMGNGTTEDIHDIVFVRPEHFSPMQTPVIAQAIGSDQPAALRAAPAVPADWLWPLGQLPSLPGYSGGLEPDIGSAGDR